MLNFEEKKKADKKDAFYRKCLPAALTNRQKEVNGDSFRLDHQR